MKKSAVYLLSFILAVSSVFAEDVSKSDTPILRLGVLSDIHVRNYNQGKRILPGLRYFCTNGADAVCIPGDFTEYGLVSELKAVGELWNEVFPGDKNADGKNVEKLFVRGNHDKMSMGKVESMPEGPEREAAKINIIGFHPAESWKEVFGIGWYTEKVMLREVNGIKCVLVDWSVSKKDIDDFFAQYGDMLKREKHFFYIQHGPPAGTVGKEYGGSDHCGGDNGQSARYLKQYPNCIALSGHSHYSISFADQIWQGEYLSIGCGCAQYVWNRPGRDNSWTLPKGYKGRNKRCPSGAVQGQYILLFPDRLVIERWDFANMEKVGPDQVIPFDGTKPYAIEEQLKRARAPQFPKDSSLSFEIRDFHYRVSGENWFDEKQLWVSYPRAEHVDSDEGRVYEYECAVTEPGSTNGVLIARRELAVNYYLNDSRLEKKPVTAFGLEELPKGKKLRYEVWPLDQFGNKGKSVSAEFCCD